MKDSSCQFGGVQIQAELNELVRDGETIKVSPRVMDVLVYLISHRDRVVPTDELLEHFWPGRIVEESTVHRLISQMRNALGDSASEQDFIKTISKRGYQAVATVETADLDASAVTQSQSAPAAAKPEQSVSSDGYAPTRRPWVLAALAVLVLACASAGYQYLRQDAPADLSAHAAHAHLETIAVLPFVNLNSNVELQFYGEGLAEVVLDHLSQSEVLKVASRTSAFQLASEGLDVQTIAQRLQVAYVLEGSIQATGEQVRITVQLIRGADGYHVWSRVYDRAGEDPLNVQQEVGRNAALLAEAYLHNDAPREHPELFAEYAGINPKAVNYYLDAQKISVNIALGNGGQQSYARQLVETAVAVDPNFAAAYEDIAWHYTIRTDPDIDVNTASAQARAAIAKALELKPDSSGAPFFLIQVLKDLDLNYAEAERLINKERAAFPEGRWWSAFLAHIAIREGRLKDGRQHLVSQVSRGAAAGEELPFTLQMYAQFLLIAGEPNKAIQATDQILNLAVRGRPMLEALLIRARALIDLGRVAEAQQVVDEAWTHAEADTRSRFAPVYLLLGDASKAREILAGVTPQNRNRGDFVEVYLGLGEYPTAFAMMREAIEDRDGSVIDYMRTPGPYEAIVEDPRFRELLELLATLETPTEDFLTASD